MAGTPLRVGFIGLGLMGLPMSLNVLRAGFPLTVWNRTASKARAALDSGAQAGRSPADVASRSDVVITMVSDSPDVEEVVLGREGVLEGARPGCTLVDMSTIAPKVTRSLAQRLAERGVELLDAPVSGGTLGAQNGTLSIMVGGKPQVLERCRPVLQAMGQRITYCGPNGMGQVAKLANQIIAAGTLAAVCEGLVFAATAGADLNAVHQAVSGGAASSWQLEHLGRRILNGDFAPGFMVKLMAKDLRLVAEAAEELGVSQLVTPAVRQLFRTAEQLGYGEEGTQAAVKVLESLAKKEARAG
ncbi:MAG: NAD(P)-dependent oxidoreductase [Dehalococcoidia bacterium]|nr:NAD(P)-dependent oxidoreductase [Dehalococcoidia bacterium]